MAQAGSQEMARNQALGKPAAPDLGENPPLADLLGCPLTRFEPGKSLGGIWRGTFLQHAKLEILNPKHRRAMGMADASAVAAFFVPAVMSDEEVMRGTPK